MILQQFSETTSLPPRFVNPHSYSHFNLNDSNQFVPLDLTGMKTYVVAITPKGKLEIGYSTNIAVLFGENLINGC